MAELKWERCKFHLNLSKKSKHDYQLRLIGGDCLEAVGVPDKGRALINCQIEPKVGDLVWCDNYMGTIHGYIKQVKSIDGDEMIVQTRYKDKSKDFEFYAGAIHGVVEMVFDIMGDLRYKRTNQEVARALIEKNTPKKPIYVDVRYRNHGQRVGDGCSLAACYKCPNCQSHIFHVFDSEHNCIHCGQAIDWSAAEENL